MSDLSVLPGPVRLMLQQEQLALRPFATTLDSFPSTAATYQFYTGIVNAPGMRWRSISMITQTALAVHATNYISFQPILAYEGVIKRIGTKRVTNVKGILANTPFRLHDEKDLGRVVPVGSAVGFEAVVTGAPSLTRPFFQADLYANA